ncbi:hypothetical protein P0W64_15585 [Tsukamurella sp. 8F]|uniref:hypothetical protein n=1 Tax=unclassified Tsukamurella TaxID=2633480 RepID=UPI0023B8E92F|nr:MULTISPECIES: hypothetical protein [unclassified Tsukamurella]MDF0530854.1 hypothetical protein [Tsukamurella sp. 8J]MDF0588201.1 hypothetical protein [Tsukamurella sp. 8F]
MKMPRPSRRAVATVLAAAAVLTVSPAVATAAPAGSSGGSPQDRQAICWNWSANRGAAYTSGDKLSKYLKGKKPTWDGAAPLADAAARALRSESSQTSALIDRAAGTPDLQGALRDYKTRLDTYASALTADVHAQPPRSWKRTNPAGKAYNAAYQRVVAACKA